MRFSGASMLSACVEITYREKACKLWSKWVQIGKYLLIFNRCCAKLTYGS